MRGEGVPELGRGYLLFIDGRFVESTSGARIAMGTSSLAQASADDVHLAVLAARRASPVWRMMPPADRALVLYRMTELLTSRSESFGDITSATERGMWYAGVCDKIDILLGACVPVAGPYVVTTAIEPLGVVGISGPSDGALDAAIAALFPALAAANTIVAVAPPSPHAMLVLAECAGAAGLPPGVLNVLTGDQAMLSSALTAHGAVDRTIAFDTDAEGGQNDDRLDAIMRMTRPKTIRQTAGI